MKEEDRKDEVTKVNEKERSSEEEVIRMMMMRTEEKSIRRRKLGRVNKEDGEGRKTEVMRWMIILQEREEVMRWRIERNEGWRGGEDD